MFKKNSKKSLEIPEAAKGLNTSSMNKVLNTSEDVNETNQSSNNVKSKENKDLKNINNGYVLTLPEINNKNFEEINRKNQEDMDSHIAEKEGQISGCNIM